MASNGVNPPNSMAFANMSPQAMSQANLQLSQMTEQQQAVIKRQMLIARQQQAMLQARQQQQHAAQQQQQQQQQQSNVNTSAAQAFSPNNISMMNGVNPMTAAAMMQASMRQQHMQMPQQIPPGMTPMQYQQYAAAMAKNAVMQGQMPNQLLNGMNSMNGIAPQAAIPLDSRSASVASDALDRQRIAVVLEMNVEIIKLLVQLQPSNSTNEKEYSGLIQRLQSNLTYLAGMADRAQKPGDTKPSPQPPIIQAVSASTHVDVTNLTNVYKRAATLFMQPNLNATAHMSPTTSQPSTPVTTARPSPSPTPPTSYLGTPPSSMVVSSPLASSAQGVAAGASPLDILAQMRRQQGQQQQLQMQQQQQQQQQQQPQLSPAQQAQLTMNLQRQMAMQQYQQQQQQQAQHQQAQQQQAQQQQAQQQQAQQQQHAQQQAAQQAQQAQQQLQRTSPAMSAAMATSMSANMPSSMPTSATTSMALGMSSASSMPYNPFAMSGAMSGAMLDPTAMAQLATSASQNNFPNTMDPLSALGVNLSTANMSAPESSMGMMDPSMSMYFDFENTGTSGTNTPHTPTNAKMAQQQLMIQQLMMGNDEDD